ncbi:MAG: IS66-like element accessory protein TnpA [Acidobacteriaceae bacterium]
MVGADLSDGLAASPSRRRRSSEERRRIVEETLGAGSSVARVARKHGVNANQVFQWRRLYRDGKLGAPPQGAMKLLPVSVSDEEELPKPAPVEGVPLRASAIHIELRGEVRITLEGSVDPATVRVVLKSLHS